VRARHTAELLARALDRARAPTDWEELRPGTPAVSILARLNREKARAKEVVVVGHEPTLGELVGLSLTGDAVSVVRLAKAGAAAIEFDRAAVPSGGRLAWLLTRKQLGRLEP
jgi:phosphohistidine phosphatase SixA